MDDTGSATFVMFDRIVTQFVGRNVQELIDGIQKVWFVKHYITSIVGLAFCCLHMNWL